MQLMKNLFSFTRVSSNAKTGPIPVTMTDSASCPDTCAFKGQGCYAQTGTVSMHWRRLDKLAAGAVSQGTKGYGTAYTQSQLLGAIQALPKGQLWRHNAAGDLPHHAGTINAEFMQGLTRANNYRRGFTYTHHDIESNKVNRALIKQANQYGFTVNLSGNNPEHADTLKAMNIGPVVCVLPDEWKPGQPKTQQTPAGNTIVICPAVTDENINCAQCGLCAVSTRKSIVGFPVHGVGKRKAANASRGVIPIKVVK